MSDAIEQALIAEGRRPTDGSERAVCECGETIYRHPEQCWKHVESKSVWCDSSHTDTAFPAPGVPLAERLRQAADAVIELNSMEGFHAPERAGVSAKYLLEAAARMEADE